MIKKQTMEAYLLKLCQLYVITLAVVNCFSGYREVKALEERKTLAIPKVVCSTQGIKAVFGPHVRNNVGVKDVGGAVVPVPENEESCGVKLVANKNQSVVFRSQYDGCFTVFEDRAVVVPLLVQLTVDDQWYSVNISCPLVKRYVDKTRRPPSSLSPQCDTPTALRVKCDPQKSPNISREVCLKLQCCYDDRDRSCFYKPNSCSMDGHFVFSVTAADTDPYPIPPTNLIVKDHPYCFPVITTSDIAVFKVGLRECGATLMEVNNTVVYVVEVADATDPSFGLQVTCEYELSEMKKAADLSGSFMVTNPPPAVAHGNIDVQMKIARDASFSSFYTEDELPVTLPLRKNAHVEISITQPSPDPTLSLNVKDCFAYPATKHSVWKLLHDGCPNPLDDMHSSVPVDHEGKIAFHSQVRRFDVRIFTFLDPYTGHYSTEPLYFYCWVEICPIHTMCAQLCSITCEYTLIFFRTDFQTKTSIVAPKRKRREAFFTSHLNLISLGPLLVKRNGTDEDDACQKSKKVFQVAVYVLAGIVAALLLISVCIAIKTIRRCRNVLRDATSSQVNTE